LNSFYDGKKQLRLPSKYSAAATQHFDIAGETREQQRINNDYIRIMPTIKSSNNGSNNLSFSNNNNNNTNKEIVSSSSTKA